MKAIILVQSTNRSTYTSVLNELLSINIGINDITWAFLETPKNRNIIPSQGKINEHYIEIKKLSDLEREISDIKILDVTGISKENLIIIFSMAANIENVKLYTLSKNSTTGETAYTDLTSNTEVEKLINATITYKKSKKFIIRFIIITLASLTAAWLLNFDPSSPFIVWLGIFLGILGAAPAIKI